MKNITVLTGAANRTAGGLFFSVRKLSEGINKRKNYNVNVVSYNESEFNDDFNLWNNVNLYKASYLGPKNYKFSFNHYKILSKTKPDIVHIHGIWMHQSKSALKMARKDVPVIISPRGMLDEWALNNKSVKKKIISFLHESELFSRISAFHALNEKEALSIHRLGLNKPIFVVPNGIDIVDSIENKYNTKENYLLFLGRIDNKKGIRELLDAWLLFKKFTQSSLKLKIAGWGDDTLIEHINNFTHINGLIGEVEFVGPAYNEDKHKLLSEASYFILPSKSEGLPMSILEAWSYKLPVLMTPECNLSNSFDINAAICIKDSTAESIFNALSQLVSMPIKELNTISLNGFELVKEQYSWANISLEMEIVYDWLLKNGKAPNTLYSI